MRSEPLNIYDFLSRKYPNKDFFELYEIRNRIAIKLPAIENISDKRYKHNKLNPKILKEKFLELFKVLVNKKYQRLEQIEKCRDIIEKEDLRYYSQFQKYNFSNGDSFSEVYNFYYSDLTREIKKYKKWTSNRDNNVYWLLSSIIDKYNSKIREMEYYKSIRKFKKTKKQTFLISFEFSGTYNLSDWYGTHKEKIYILISDASREAVLGRLQKNKKATSLVTNMLPFTYRYNGIVGTIQNIQFLPFEEENINLAKRLSNKKYDKWNCHSKEINFLRGNSSSEAFAFE